MYKKRMFGCKRLFPLLIALVLLSALVYAAGTSTVPNVDRDSNSVQEDPMDSDEEVVDKARITDSKKASIRRVRERLIERKDAIVRAANENGCEDLDDRAERIACRLKRYKNYPAGDYVDYDKRTPEACRSLRNSVACVALYKNVNNKGCYEMEGRKKDRCFKRVLGSTKAKLRDLDPEERREKARNYLVLLLYELQERIEHANERGRITNEDAADVIDLIVELKQNILDELEKEEVKEKLVELKKKIRALRSNGGSE
jgi:hypothetical protein